MLGYISPQLLTAGERFGLTWVFLVQYSSNKGQFSKGLPFFPRKIIWQWLDSIALLVSVTRPTPVSGLAGWKLGWGSCVLCLTVVLLSPQNSLMLQRGRS